MDDKGTICLATNSILTREQMLEEDTRTAQRIRQRFMQQILSSQQLWNISVLSPTHIHWIFSSPLQQVLDFSHTNTTGTRMHTLGLDLYRWESSTYLKYAKFFATALRQSLSDSKTTAYCATPKDLAIARRIQENVLDEEYAAMQDARTDEEEFWSKT